MAVIGLSFGILLLGFAFVPQSPAMEHVNVATPSYGLIELPVVVAQRSGYFRDERLEIQKIQIDPEIAVKALLAGEARYGLAWEASIHAAAAGLPIKMIAGIV